MYINPVGKFHVLFILDNTVNSEMSSSGLERPFTPSSVTSGSEGVKKPSASVCPICSDDLIKPLRLVLHMIEIHRAKWDKMEKVLTTASGVDSQLFDKDSCVYCPVSFPTVSDCLTHICAVHVAELKNCPPDAESSIKVQLQVQTGTDKGNGSQTVSLEFVSRIKKA